MKKKKRIKKGIKIGGTYYKDSADLLANHALPLAVAITEEWCKYWKAKGGNIDLKELGIKVPKVKKCRVSRKTIRAIAGIPKE